MIRLCSWIMIEMGFNFEYRWIWYGSYCLFQKAISGMLDSERIYKEMITLSLRCGSLLF
jgi:hypothetical protein